MSLINIHLKFNWLCKRKKYFFFEFLKYITAAFDFSRYDFSFWTLLNTFLNRANWLNIISFSFFSFSKYRCTLCTHTTLCYFFGFNKINLYRQTLSTYHFGNPLSTVDAMIASYRKGLHMHPESCHDQVVVGKQYIDPCLRSGTCWDEREEKRGEERRNVL